MEVDGKRLDDDTVSELCEPCQEGNVSTHADGYCNDCEEYMCQTCFQSHVKMKVLRNHVLGALNAGRKLETQSQAEKCKKHKTENIKYYCRSHDSVACGDCLLFDHRKCEPEPEFIRDLAKNIEESLIYKNIFTEVESLEEFKAEIELAIGRNRKENTEFHDKAIHEIQKCRTEINTWLENVTSKIEAEEIEIWKTNEVMMSKLEDWIQIISDMINEVRDEISTEKYTSSENLFILVIECKSKLSEFARKTVPEIKSNLNIKSFAFEPNPKLFVLTKLANFGIIRLGRDNDEFQTSQEVRQNEMAEHEAEVVRADKACNFKTREDPVQVELEQELKQLRQTTSEEKKKKEILQQSYDTLKKEHEDQVSLLSREREERDIYVLHIKELVQGIVLLKHEFSSLKDLNTSLKSQLDSRNKEFSLLGSSYKTRQEQDHNKIKALQSELKKLSENYEKECTRRSSQIQDSQRQIKSAMKTYQLSDPRAAGLDVGKRVNNKFTVRTGTVTAVDPSGYVDVNWDDGGSGRNRAGAGGQYWVKLL